MLKIITLKRWREERQALRLSLLVAIQALAKAKVQLDGGHAKVLADGFELVRKPEDPSLGFEKKTITEASRIMRVASMQGLRGR